MNELRDEFNAFRVQQEVLNESYRERFFSIDERIQSIKQKPEENNGTFSNVVQTQDIQNKLQTFEERITSLEALNHRPDTKVILTLKETVTNFLNDIFQFLRLKRIKIPVK